MFLDSSAPRLSGSRGEITAEQLAFLDDTDTTDAFVFVHHPIHYRNLEDSYWWDTYPERAFCGNKKEINSILNGRAAIVVNGHVHDTTHTRYKGIDHMTVNAFNKETRESGVTGTYTELTATDGELVVDVNEQDAVVQSVTVDR